MIRHNISALRLLVLLVVIAGCAALETGSHGETPGSTAEALHNPYEPATEAELEIAIPDDVDVFDLTLEQVRKYSAMKNFEVLGHSYLRGPWRTEFAREHGLGTGFYGLRVNDGIAYLGGADYPFGNTFGIVIADVSDPLDIRPLSFIPSPPGTRTGAYLRVNPRRKILVSAFDKSGANPNQPPGDEPTLGGVAFYDISDLSDPRQVGFLMTRPGGSTHGFEIDDRYVYTCANGPESKLGPIGNNAEVQIIDYEDPANPVLVSRYHVQGQHEGEFFEPRDQFNLDGSPQTVSCHEIELANKRLYVAYRDAGMLVIDVSKPEAPELVSRYDMSPPYNGGILGGSHTVFPINAGPGKHADLVLYTDEIGFSASLDYSTLNDCPPSFGWLIDISELSNPQVLSTIRIPGINDNYDYRTGRFVCPETGFHSMHYPWVDFRSPSLVYITWYDQGIRVFDISNPFIPKEAGYYLSPRFAVPGQPAPTLGRQTFEAVTDPSTNLVYATDGNGGGLTILRWTGPIPERPPLPGAR